MRKYFLKLIEHEYWANLSVLEMYFKCADPPPRAISLLSHVVAAQRIWIDRAKGNELVVQPFDVFDEDALLDLLEINYVELTAMVQTCDFEQLFSFGSERTPPKSIGQMLLHVVLHAAYHRGQLVLLLKRDNNSPPQTDFIHWVN